MTDIHEPSKRSEPIPVTIRERRLHARGRRLRQPLIRAIQVVLGKGPRGRNSEVCEVRNTYAPELWGVIGANVIFRGQRWLVVTAPGDMFLGLRQLDLLGVCARLHHPDRPVLLLDEDDVRRLNTYWGPKRFRPKFEDLPDDLQQALLPLFTYEVSGAEGETGKPCYSSRASVKA